MKIKSELHRLGGRKSLRRKIHLTRKIDFLAIFGSFQCKNRSKSRLEIQALALKIRFLKNPSALKNRFFKPFLLHKKLVTHILALKIRSALIQRDTKIRFYCNCKFGMNAHFQKLHKSIYVSTLWYRSRLQNLDNILSYLKNALDVHNINVS